MQQTAILLLIGNQLQFKSLWRFLLDKKNARLYLLNIIIQNMVE